MLWEGNCYYFEMDVNGTSAQEICENTAMQGGGELLGGMDTEFFRGRFQLYCRSLFEDCAKT